MAMDASALSGLQRDLVQAEARHLECAPQCEKALAALPLDARYVHSRRHGVEDSHTRGSASPGGPSSVAEADGIRLAGAIEFRILRGVRHANLRRLASHDHVVGTVNL